MGDCSLIGMFGFFVQILLGVIAFLVLVIKRQIEKPKRQWKIWAMDSSKQLVSMGIAHVLNVLLALVLSRESSQDQCNWYFITVVLDTTLGMVLSLQFLRIVEKILDRYGKSSLKSGNYVRVITPEEQVLELQNEEDNNNEQVRRQQIHDDFQKQSRTGTASLLRPIIVIDFKIWGAQLLVWIFVVCLAKLLLYVLQLLLEAQFQYFSEFVLQGLDDSPDSKLLLVVVVIPVILNGFQFWVQDGFLKKRDFTQAEKQYALQEFFELQMEMQDMIPQGLTDNNNQSQNGKRDNQINRMDHDNYIVQELDLQSNHQNEDDEQHI